MKKLFYLLFGLLFIPHTYAATADAQLILKQEQISDSSVTISIHIENPSAQKIKAVQSWIKYDPSILKGEKINTDSSPFDFVAPGENNFDEKQGLVKIGRSTLAEGLTDTDLLVAELSFKRLKSQRTTLSFYNFSLGNDSNTSVRVFEDGFPVNILKETPQTLNIAGSTSQKSTKNTATETTVSIPQQAILQGRPQNVRVSTGTDYVILSWSALKKAEGYNVYYSNRSGRYLQRRSIGNETEYYLGGLQKGQVYYFAVTAYGKDNKETDYSNEVRVRVGASNSSSSPLLLTRSDQLLKGTKQNVQTGPTEILFLATMIAGALTTLLVSRRKI